MRVCLLLRAFSITPIRCTAAWLCRCYTVKPVFSEHIKQDIFLAFQTGGCLLQHERSAESTCMSFLHFFHSAISNHLSIAMSMSPESMVA